MILSLCPSNPFSLLFSSSWACSSSSSRWLLTFLSYLTLVSILLSTLPINFSNCCLYFSISFFICSFYIKDSSLYDTNYCRRERRCLHYYYIWIIIITDLIISSGECWRNTIPLELHPRAGLYSELRSLPCLCRTLNVGISDELSLPARDREDHIVHEEKPPHFIDGFRMLCKGHWWTTRQVGCIQEQLLYKLQEIPVFYIVYFCGRSIKPEHFSCADLKSRIEDGVHHLSNIVLSNEMRLDD